MRVILASPRGFCAGVNMAIESLELAIQVFGTPIYVYHEIVHNKHVVETFRNRGAVFVDHLEEVPQGATLLFSAHGVSPEIRKHRRRAQPPRHRCHVPAGDQGPSRGDSIRAKAMSSC